MPPTDEEVIDLTFSEDEGDNEPDSRRKRTRYNYDDEIMIVESDAAVVQASEPETANGVDDDEVKLVSATGVEVWTSLPHTRDLCRQCPFKLGAALSNAKYCDRCFCYICDCPASECKDWGNGAARAHHCNATNKSLNYRTQRQEHLKKNRAERDNAAGGGGNGGPSGSAAATAAPAVRTAAGFAELANRARIVLRVGDAVQRAPIPLPNGMLAPSQSAGSDSSPPVSDSSDDDDSGCNCFNCRRRRGGYYHGMDDEMYNSDDPYERYMAGLQGIRPVPNTKKPEAPKVCNMKEMSDPLLDPTMIELTTITFQAEANGSNKISDLAKRLVPHGFYSPDPGTNKNEKGDRLTLRTLVEDKYQSIGPSAPDLKLSPLYLTPSPPEPSSDRVIPIVVHYWDGRAAPTRYGVRILPGNTLEFMLNMLRLNLKLDSTLAMKLSLSRYPSTAPDTKMTDEWLSSNIFTHTLGEPNVYCVPEGPAMSSTRATVALVQMHWLTTPVEQIRNETAPKLPKVLIPLRDAQATGGLAACDAMASKVIAALRPYRVSPDNADETRRLENSLRSRITWGTRYPHTSPTTYAHPERENHVLMMYGTTLFNKTKGINLTASFSETDLGAFNTDMWKGAVAVDPSGAADAVNPTETYIKALKKVLVANDEEKRLPKRVLYEIDDASRMWDPALVLNATVASLGPRALVRYKAQLTPITEETKKGKKITKTLSEKRGELKIRVFVFRTGGRNRIGFFDQGNDWGAAAARGRNRTQRTITPHTLNLILWCHLQQNSQFVALEEHRKHWASKDGELAARRSITALMEAMERPEAPAAVQPRGLTVTLRPYQLQSLKFMLDAEACHGGFRKHLWVPATAADGTAFWYSPLLGRVASEVAEQPSGGWNCEEMGLGKTVEILALCLANPAPPLPAPGTVLSNRKLHSRATLVVCAVSLVGQWIAEAEEKTAGSLKIHMYHGAGRIKDARRLATEFDLVVTTYATLSADCGRINNPRAANRSSEDIGKNTVFSVTNSPLHGVQWHRLVLDESHTCKNPAVGHTKACVALEAKRRWMCTGTPINTDVQDLFGQFAVLGFSPFNNRAFFDCNVKNAFGNNVYGGGCPELLHGLGAIMVRHTKRQELGGEQVLQLPPKTEEFVPVILTATEQAVYKRVHATAAEYFSRYERMGPQYVSKNLLHIMSLLLPMRRICSGGALAERDLTITEPAITAEEAQYVADGGDRSNSGSGNNNTAAGELKVDENLVAPAGEECPICMDAYEEPAVTTCNHWYCKTCIVNVLQTMHSRCPLCRGPQRINQLRCGITAAEAADRNAENSEDNDAELLASQAAAEIAAAERLAEREAEVVSIGNGVISESKLAALLKSLRAMRRADPTAKALIFSQYNSTIEWLKGRLTREGFGHRHISGSMPLKQRAKAIQAFQGDPPTTVFLLSMRSGAVGINLTAASHVYLLEPALNPALEDQAVGRAWRMGQRREVKVVRFYVKGSVEEQIIDVVKRRQTGVAGAAAANANGGASGSGGAGPSNYNSDDELNNRRYRPHIRVEDQAGSIKEDKQNLRLGELQALFKLPEFPEPRTDEALSEEEEEDEAMPDAGEYNNGDGVDYSALYSRNDRMQQQQQMDDTNEAGTSDMHAAIGNNHKAATTSVPAAMLKNRMRRSKAGIASVTGANASAAAAGTTSAPAAAAVTTTPGGVGTTVAADAGPSNANGNGALTAANGVTPAVTLQAAPATGARQPATATAAAAQEEEEEEVVEVAPAAILQRIKLLAQKATGRLTPVVNGNIGTQRAATVAATSKAARAADLTDEVDTEDEEDLDKEALNKLLDDEGSPEPQRKKGRGRPPITSSRVDAITSHIPNPTPDTTGGAGGSGSGSGGVNGRPSRRPRPNYAVLANQGIEDAA